MIRNSFVLLERVSYAKEQAIWDQGITDWNMFLQQENIKGISKKTKLYYDKCLLQARLAIRSGNSSYFLGKLAGADMWRLYDEFKDECVYLDIEVSGTKRYDDITMIGLNDGYESKVMFRNNFEFEFLKTYLSRFKLVVTYNGASFDLPFLKKRYPGLLPNIPHIDLRPLCQKVGLTGGLKEVEKKLGIKRSSIIEKMYGGDPYLLWRKYWATGEEYFLRLLIEYNEEDVANLKRISGYTIDKLTKRLLINRSSIC